MRNTVLIIDDDAAIREALKKVLTQAGYEIVVAADGAEATARFVPEKIDLVLLDLNLPQQSGWDVFEHFTTLDPFVPVIIITGLNNQYGTALAAGASALMEKPIEVPALLRVMDEALAEPKETQLRRMCGYQQDTRYLRPRHSSDPGQLLSLARRSGHRRHPPDAPRWKEA